MPHAKARRSVGGGSRWSPKRRRGPGGTELNRLVEEQEALFVAAETAVDDAEADVLKSMAAADAARKALRDAGWAVRGEEEACIEGAHRAAQRDLELKHMRAMQELVAAMDKESMLLRQENVLLREELRMVEPFLPQLRRRETWASGDISRGSSPTLIRRWYELVHTAEG